MSSKEDALYKPSQTNNNQNMN